MFARLKNSWLLFKTTLSFIGKDKSLFAVPILLPIANIVLLIILGAMAFSLFVVAFDSQIAWFFFGVIAIFLSFVVNTFLGAAHSWMVFEVAKGKDTTLGSGIKRAMHNLADVLWFAIVMTVVKIITNALRGKNNNGGFIRHLLAGMIEGVVGIMGKLVLPAMIVTDKTFKEAVIDLKKSLKTWPEILAFEVGMGPLFGLVFFVAALLLAGISFLLFAMIGVYAIAVFIISLILLIIILSILSSFIEATYYTLLYLALVEKKHLKNISDVFHTKF